MNSNDAADLWTAGWAAAKRSEAFDPERSEHWIEGYMQWELENPTIHHGLNAGWPIALAQLDHKATTQSPLLLTAFPFLQSAN